MKKIKLIVNTILLAALVFIIFSGCEKTPELQTTSWPLFASFRDIPGVTNEEIAAIEALKAARQSFSLGTMLTTETFILPDNTTAGFAFLFSKLLTELFEIPFVHEFHEWASLKSSVDNTTIDFTTELTPTQERLEIYFMSSPIARRSLLVLTYGDSVKMQNEQDLNGRRLGFWQGTITAQAIKNFYSTLRFEEVDILDSIDAVEKLRSGTIDAHIIDSVDAHMFKGYPAIRYNAVIPWVSTNTSLTTANPDLAPIISVVDKYIAAGGSRKLRELHRAGNLEYRRHILFKSLSDEERAYLTDLTKKVPIVLRSDLYPINFFNHRDNEFQGITIDILAEISELTGIEFEIINDVGAPFAELIEMLRSGEASLITSLHYLEYREEYFIWVNPHFLTSAYVFLSKVDFPSIDLFQLQEVTVGAIRGTSYAPMYNLLFPGLANLVLYATNDDALDALGKGEIDLLFTLDYLLYYQINYREKHGFKINYTLPATINSFMGLNRNEVTLHSIISASISFIDIDSIVNYWESRRFDYSAAMARARAFYFAISSVILFVLLIVLVIFFIHYTKAEKIRALAKVYKYANELNSSLAKIVESPAFSSGILKDAAGIVAQEGTLALNIQRIGIWSISEDMKSLKSIVCYDTDAGGLFVQDDFDMASNPKYLSALLSSRLLALNTPEELSNFNLLRDYDSALCGVLDAPIRFGGKLVGVICCEQKYCAEFPDKREWVAEEQSFASSLADFMTIAVANDERHALMHRTKTMLNNLPGMVYQSLNNYPHYTCTFVSEGCSNLIGYTPEELIDNRNFKYIDIIHPEDVELYMKISKEALLANSTFEASYRIITKDGTEKWIWERSNIIKFDHDGTPSLFEAFCTDITEQRRLEVIARESQAKIAAFNTAKTMLDANPLMCNLWSRDYQVFDCNDMALELFEMNKQDYMEKFKELAPEFQPDGKRTADKVRELIDTAFRDGKIVFEWMSQKLDGTLIPLEVSLTRIAYGDGYAAVGYGRDLREQKALIEEMRRAEIAEESDKAKSKFLAFMSHEIRTPMNSILGFAELALGKAITSQAKDYLQKITNSTKWLLHIINDILDISKIESGKMELERIPFDLYELIMQCQSVILPSAKEKELDLKFYIEPLPGKKLIGDPVRLYQVIINLLSNGVKFTNAGAVKFSSQIKSSKDNNTTIYFEVRDSGIGLAPEQFEKIFEPFTQADTSTTRKYGGTGLGLTISKNIVELMGGKLMIESAPNVGSTFSFEVTFETVDASDDTPSHARFTSCEKPYFKGLVLVCDDNLMNQLVVCEHLSDVGLQAIVAENGQIGVEMVEDRIEKGEKPFDLILMDIFMPVMDGLEAASIITKMNTGTPIVAVTANIITGELENYRKHGMLDCLGKPFTSQELWRILLRHLTPVSTFADYEHEQAQRQHSLQKNLQVTFYKNNQTKHTEIAEAISAGDIKLAHRLVHTLKGNAGQLGKTKLQTAAAQIEDLLKDELISIPEEKISLLKTELTLVLEELKPMMTKEQKKFKPMNPEQVLALFEKLEHLLENINPECINLLDDIRSIPGTGELVRQIEDYDFESAGEALAKLKEKWL
ncbi:MAG: transporter substrate-binding domain-containing protein [Spirochaetes bacterium]|nr:transporter substrate-binding domain-containing protein [Spirochaetota bacterium]